MAYPILVTLKAKLSSQDRVASTIASPKEEMKEKKGIKYVSAEESQ